MTGTFAAHFQSYLDFATVDGTADGVGSWLLIGGPVLVALLGLYAVWNLLAAVVSGTVRAGRLARRQSRALLAGPAVAAPIALPLPRTEVLVRTAA